MKTVIDELQKCFGSHISEIKISEDNKVVIEISPDNIKEIMHCLTETHRLRFSTLICLNDPGSTHLKYIFFDDLESMEYEVIIKFYERRILVDSVSDIIPAAENSELETRELFGIEFSDLSKNKNLILNKNYRGRKTPLKRDF